MNSVVFPIGKTTICNIENNRDTSVIFIIWQCMWRGIWHLTLYVIFQWISFSDKVCDRVNDTWHFSKYHFPTRFVTGDMTTRNRSPDLNSAVFSIYPIGKKALFKKKQFEDNTFVYEQGSLSYRKSNYLQYKRW